MNLSTIKHWLQDLNRYPIYRTADDQYDDYWASRDMQAPLNTFQRARTAFICKQLPVDASILDVGCGDGRILAELVRLKPGISVTGIDNSASALERARARGIETVQADIRDPSALHMEQADFVLLLEVLEHMTNSEELLAWSLEHARKGVIFSVPNTGFFTHRLRLLLGKFPLQWRAHPSEHVRFWTLHDMRWWLGVLGLDYRLTPYEGVPLLGRWFPGLFSAGLIVVVIPQHRQESEMSE